MKIGRKTMPKRDHKTSVSISMRKELKRKLKEVAEKHDKKYSDLVVEMLETVLFNNKAYAAYMIRQKMLEVSYWEFEYQRASGKIELKDQTGLEDYGR